MKPLKKILFLGFSLLVLKSGAQDTAHVLFIGNSFTYANNMPSIFKEMADSAHIAVSTGMHAPGGVSVGDTAQGTMAHMNNPALFALIRSKKWDYAVIQDNQGRFVEDSAVFPAKSKVVQGHLNIMDSVKANNSCAKIILFAGWGWKNGYPGVASTGIGVINRILTNYVVLNDTMKEVVAPIGEAWKKAVNYLPSVNLWDADDAHPSYSGSFLTASVIFSTIFNTQAESVNYNGLLSPLIAGNLRAFADSSVFNSISHNRYNLGGIKIITPQESNGQLFFSENFMDYSWYKNNVYVGSSPTLALSGPGNYIAVVTESNGSIVKSCNYYSGMVTGVSHQQHLSDIHVFPNPVTGSVINIAGNITFNKIELISLSGQIQKIISGDSVKSISTDGLAPGCYFLVLRSKNVTRYQKIIISD